ncbi:hypothetical protein [Blastomonas sp. SL216]|nr:hypothetical protein OU999_16430 [Blastomonas sp. SL216]
MTRGGIFAAVDADCADANPAPVRDILFASGGYSSNQAESDTHA